MEKSMDKIVALAKARGFIYPGSEIYGGLANTWDYGNLGVELKKASREQERSYTDGADNLEGNVSGENHEKTASLR